MAVSTLGYDRDAQVEATTDAIMSRLVAPAEESPAEVPEAAPPTSGDCQTEVVTDEYGLEVEIQDCAAN